jgi:hypothetical protein
MTNSPSPKSEVEVLRDKIAWLEQEVRRLSDERDKALKVKETVIQQVLPLASPTSRGSSWSGRGLSLAIMVLLIAAMIGLVMYMPRMSRKMSIEQPLPPGVQVREEEPEEEELEEDEPAYEDENGYEVNP